MYQLETLVLVRSDTGARQWDAGELWINVEFDGDLVSVVTMYSFREFNTTLCAATWDVRDAPVFVRTSDILCSLVYKRVVNGSQVSTLIPLQFG